MLEKPSKSPAARYCREALQSHEEGDSADALAILSFAFERDASYKPAYQAAADILTASEDEPQARLFRQAVETFHDPAIFARLGTHFFDQGQTRLAIPFLRRADRLRPSHPETLVTLAIALGAEGRFQESLAALERHPHLATQFWPAHELVYTQLLLGNFAAAQEGWARIQSRIDELRTTVSEEEADDFDFATSRIEGALSRQARIARAGDFPLRDWHFIQYGTLILEYLDLRFGEKVAENSSGRFVALDSAASLVKRVCVSLAEALGALELAPRRILHAGDHESEVLAELASILLALPASSLAGSATREDALVIVAYSEDLNEFGELAERDPGEIVFAYAVQWAKDCVVVPDIAGLLAQFHYFPWEPAEAPEEPIAFDLPADPRPPREVARSLADLPPAPAGTRWAETLEFYRANRAISALDDWIANPFRERFLTNSPVRSWKQA